MPLYQRKFVFKKLEEWYKKQNVDKNTIDEQTPVQKIHRPNITANPIYNTKFSKK